jgi:uncharacterized membrane protein
MRLSILSGIAALLLWCVTDTSLTPEHVRNSKGEITFRGILSIVLAQIVLWAVVFFFALPVVRHLPGFFITRWRFGVTFFLASCARWFALLMVLQYVWLIARATGKTAIMAAMAAFGSESARQSLDQAPWRFIERTEDEKKRASTRGGGTGGSG